ncbi:MAG: hypothetical protein ABI969_14725, partial [bacterium]
MTDGELPPQMGRKPDGISEEADRAPRESDLHAFASLFRDAYRKCFSAAFAAPLTESESHRLSVEIAEGTGLEIGWKSLKNYSSYLMGRTGRSENPSVPTLDTLARYVAGAAITTEERRRTLERHYPYWFRYRDGLRQFDPAQAKPEASGTEEVPRRPRLSGVFAAAVAAALASILALLFFIAGGLPHGGDGRFVDEFNDVSDVALAQRGWSVQSIDTAHWTQRAVKPGHLALFTLSGDNWPQAGQIPAIRNLLVRRAPSKCFVADMRLSSFFPSQNWQQAGILLLEDTAFSGRSVRMSIGYNDFSGGFPQVREVIIQAITSLGRESSKPEEIVHHRLFVVDSATETLVHQNLESA